MKCPNCGRKIPDDSQSCPGCKTKFKASSIGTAALPGPKLGRLLYAALFICAILVTIFIYLKWQATSIGESYTLAQMTDMYSLETDLANWFTYGTYIVLCLQLLAMIMWIVTFSRPSPVIPLLAGGVTFLGAFLFLFIAIFGISAAFERISDFTRTATVIPYLTLLISAGEIVCAMLVPKLLVPVSAETVKPEKRSVNVSSKKLLDELDGTVTRDNAKKNEK
ncbi:MAG TPA: hypothetical protein PK629_01255 [Oscillospiraceae bacterium]|nr:hypothetical protein [Oscillospiraceae bacterium]HPK36076.1 hypothetical protein [Oscillospiraceae bacterium]HPR76595.1 hypothetical protein [Oscillospiraceae bacterium]